MKPLVDASQEIARLQYTLDAETWLDVTGPLTVDQGTGIWFRAVRKNLSAPWPEGQPVWSGDPYLQEGETEGVLRTGEDMQALFLNPAPQIQCVRAECGTSFTEAQVTVLPKYWLTLTTDRDPILLGDVGQEGKARIVAKVVDPDRAPVSGVTVNFALVHNESEGTLYVSGGGSSAPTDMNGQVEAIYTSSSARGCAIIVGTAVMPDGATQEWEIRISTAPADVDVEMGEWEAMPDGRYRAPVTVTTSFEFRPLAHRPFRLLGWVTEYNSGDEPPGFGSVLTFEDVAGTTGADGTYSTGMIWDPASTPDGAEVPGNYNVVLAADDGLTVED